MVGSWFRKCSEIRLWLGSEKSQILRQLLEIGAFRGSKTASAFYNLLCLILQEMNDSIMITKIVLKSVLWRGSESTLVFCIFQLLCFFTPPYFTLLTLFILFTLLPALKLFTLLALLRLLTLVVLFISFTLFTLFTLFILLILLTLLTLLTLHSLFKKLSIKRAIIHPFMQKNK